MYKIYSRQDSEQETRLISKPIYEISTRDSKTSSYKYR